MMLYDDYSVPFQGEPQRIRIVSEESLFGLRPEPGEETEQRITINAEGRVWFSAYDFGWEYEPPHQTRRKIYKIQKEVAGQVLANIAAYFRNPYIGYHAKDVGLWRLEIVNTEGETYTFTGALCAKLEVKGIDLSDLVREALEMNDLYVFDGNNRPDRVERLTVDYRYIVNDRNNQSDGPDTSIYREQLIIDRESSTLEYIRIFEDNCTFSQKLCSKYDVDDLLNYIYLDYMLGTVEGNPEYVGETSAERREYAITFDYAKRPQQVLKGTFDRKGLPALWEDFICEVYQVLEFHNFGDIFDHRIYNRVLRAGQKYDYIYCSVEFGEGGKSYYYLADEDDDIEIGDRVEVPVGDYGHQTVATVVDIEYFTAEEVPLPVERTKYIVRKYEEPLE